MSHSVIKSLHINQERNVSQCYQIFTYQSRKKCPTVLSNLYISIKNEMSHSVIKSLHINQERHLTLLSNLYISIKKDISHCYQIFTYQSRKTSHIVIKSLHINQERHEVYIILTITHDFS